MNTFYRHRGVTLWELLWALLIGGMTLVWGVPALQSFVLDARRTADINAFVLAVQVARSEAAKRGRPVVLCKTVDRSACGDDEFGFDAGWMVFVNEDDVSPRSRAPDEPLLYAHNPAMEGTIRSNRPLYEFRAFGFRSTNGTVTFCDARAESQARAVIVSYTGRPRVAATGPGNRPLTCANLP